MPTKRNAKRKRGETVVEAVEEYMWEIVEDGSPLTKGERDPYDRLCQLVDEQRDADEALEDELDRADEEIDVQRLDELILDAETIIFDIDLNWEMLKTARQIANVKLEIKIARLEIEKTKKQKGCLFAFVLLSFCF